MDLQLVNQNRTNCRIETVFLLDVECRDEAAGAAARSVLRCVSATTMFSAPASLCSALLLTPAHNVAPAGRAGRECGELPVGE